jgi:hypothetical protein
MTSVAKEVEKHINEDVIIRRAMEKGIVSMKSLAFCLIREKKVNASVDAVVSAIRRYKDASPSGKTYEKAREVLSKSSDIRITTNITEIALEKSQETQKILHKAFSVVNYEKGETLLIVQGEKGIKLILNDSNREKIIALFPRKSIIYVEKSLAEINLHLPQEAVETPGIVATITTEFMINNINLYESVSCIPEMMLFLKQKDLVKGYEILSGLINMKD